MTRDERTDGNMAQLETSSDLTADPGAHPDAPVPYTLTARGDEYLARHGKLAVRDADLEAGQ